MGKCQCSGMQQLGIMQEVFSCHRNDDMPPQLPVKASAEGMPAIPRIVCVRGYANQACSKEKRQQSKEIERIYLPEMSGSCNVKYPYQQEKECVLGRELDLPPH